jgi:tetratricopeptide (TPR) repeat protein
LLGRARERYRLQRVREAIADLDEARAIALEIGDVPLELEILLEQATALDWVDDYDASAAIVEAVEARLADTPVPSLEVELALARGRRLHRTKQNVEASRQLRAAMLAARERGNHEIEIVAGVTLGPALVEAEDLESAEQAFDELIALCDARDDRFHLAACYANRAFLWSARGEIERTAADQRLVIQICREIGFAILERNGTHNLAEDLLWEGKLDEALVLARRCVALQRSHGESAVLWDDLLLARVLAARDERVELAAILDKLERGELTPWDRAMARGLRLAAADAAPEVWQETLQQNAAVLPTDRQIELAHLAIRRGMLTDTQRAEVRGLATRHPIWLRRLDEL